jgi:hypothetical protein
MIPSIVLIGLTFSAGDFPAKAEPTAAQPSVPEARAAILRMLMTQFSSLTTGAGAIVGSGVGLQYDATSRRFCASVQRGCLFIFEGRLEQKNGV